MHRAAVLLASIALVACGQPSAPRTEPAAEPVAEAPVPVPAPAPATIAARAPEQIAALVAALPAPYNAADYDNGKRVFAQCRSCHTVETGGVNRVGPHLHGVFGRAAGSVAEFKNYSAALKASGIVWDEAKLDAWVTNPRDLVPNSNMVFPGLRKDTDRRDLIAYLKVEATD